MDRRQFLQTATIGCSLTLSPLCGGEQSRARSAADRRCLLYIDPRLASRDLFAQQIQSGVAASPLLSALCASQRVLPFRSTDPDQAGLEQLAYNHVILLGFADDPLIQKAWQREATIRGGSIYLFGFGSFEGSLGYVESDRNPFLHAAAIPTSPYETQLITVTGTDPEGMHLAVDALLTQGLVNGLLVNQHWRRSAVTLLDRDPLPAAFQIPSVLPDSLGQLQRIAITQASRDEYRGVLADAGVEPVSIWRAKYYQPGEWDAPGLVASFHNYAVGLHRRAYGNTVWVGTFATEAIAASAAKSIANAARLQATSSRWRGTLPPYAWGVAMQGDGPSTGTMELWLEGESVLIATRTATL